MGNILLVCHYYPPHIGGIEIVAEKQARTLVAHGMQVSVVTCAVGAAPGESTDDRGVRICRASCWNFFENRFGIPFPIPCMRIITILRREVMCADIVHLHDVFYVPNWVAYSFARIYKKPIVLTQHVGLVPHSSALVMLLQKIAYSTIGRLIFTASKAIIVYNYNVKTFIASLGTDMSKVLEVRNGVDLSLFHPVERPEKDALRRLHGIPVGRPLALFVGRFVPKKGADIVYNAHDPRYEIAFVGSGSIPPQWRSTPGVHILGPLPQAKLAEVYQCADIFVLPARGELLTLAMQEALATGLPVITTDEPGYRAYDLDRNMIFFVDPSPETLREHILKIVTNPVFAKKMGAYSLALAVERFDWERNTKPLLDTYKKLTNE
jgi:D-inositol-3-phosphate glycosyltransferase